MRSSDPARARPTVCDALVNRGTAAARAPFVENDEMTQSLWWNPTDPLDGLQEIDEALVRLCPPAGTR